MSVEKNIATDSAVGQASAPREALNLFCSCSCYGFRVIEFFKKIVDFSAAKRAVKRYRNNSVVSTGPFPLTRPSHLVLESTDLRNLQRQCKLCIALVLLHVSITMYKYSNVLVFYSASIAMRYYSSVLVFRASLILRCQITLQP